MKDLTRGSIHRHLLTIALPTAAGMMCQTLYLVVDLYFVASLGDAAIAGVSIAGNVALAVFSLTQMLGVGTVALVAQAVGRKDRADANLIFNQSVSMAVVIGTIVLIAGYALAEGYVRTIAADTAAADAAAAYLHWFLPGLALQFALMAMGSALRGTGIIQPTIVAQVVSVLVNALLCPVLIAGWGTQRSLGVLGAGLASTISTLVGVGLLWGYFLKLEKYVALDRMQLRPRLDSWIRIASIGLPAGSEMVVVFVFVAVIQWLIRQVGADAQAGFGVATRVMESIFFPAMVIAFAAGPVAGQNYGAGQVERVKETFRAAALMSAAVAVLITLLCQLRAESLVRVFSDDAGVIELGAFFLRMLAAGFIANGFVITCSSLFLGLGNTWPSLASTASRLVAFVVPGAWLATQPAFDLENLYYLYVSTAIAQAGISGLLLRQQFRKRLIAFTQTASDSS